MRNVSSVGGGGGLSSLEMVANGEREAKVNKNWTHQNVEQKV